MERFIKGDIVVHFPFSDLSDSKKRPALVLADLIGYDIILCQITSKNINDMYSIPLIQSDFSSGSLHKSSKIRPNRIFTADKKIIVNKIGHVGDSKYRSVTDAIKDLIEI